MSTGRDVLAVRLRLELLQDRLLADIHALMEDSRLDAGEVRQLLMDFFGPDVFEMYADWLEADDDGVSGQDHESGAVPSDA